MKSVYQLVYQSVNATMTAVLGNQGNADIDGIKLCL
jgi:hypothetical protein